MQYATGIQETLPANLIADLTWKAGTYIECKLAAAIFSPVTIVEVRPAYAIAAVTNEDKRINTTIRGCRSVAR